MCRSVLPGDFFLRGNIRTAINRLSARRFDIGELGSGDVSAPPHVRHQELVLGRFLVV